MDTHEPPCFCAKISTITHLIYMVCLQQRDLFISTEIFKNSELFSLFKSIAIMIKWIWLEYICVLRIQFTYLIQTKKISICYLCGTTSNSNYWYLTLLLAEYCTNVLFHGLNSCGFPNIVSPHHCHQPPHQKAPLGVIFGNVFGNVFGYNLRCHSFNVVNRWGNILHPNFTP